jgi:hypothetical protein
LGRSLRADKHFKRLLALRWIQKLENRRSYNTQRKTYSWKLISGWDFSPSIRPVTAMAVFVAMSVYNAPAIPSSEPNAGKDNLVLISEQSLILTLCAEAPMAAQGRWGQIWDHEIERHCSWL